MEQRIEGEIGALLQIVAVATPVYPLSTFHFPLSTFSGIQANAHRSVLLERLQIAFEALLAHQLAGIFREQNR